MASAPPMLLAAGRYWVDLIGAERIASFGGGVKGLNEAHPGLVTIISATRHKQNEVLEYAESPDLTGVLVAIWETFAGNVQDTPERDWVLFEVSGPTVWDPQAMGTPTKAGPNVKTEADTVQRPDPEQDITDVLPTVSDVGKGIASAASTVVLVVAVAVGALILLRGKGKTGGLRV